MIFFYEIDGGRDRVEEIGRGGGGEGWRESALPWTTCRVE